MIPASYLVAVGRASGLTEYVTDVNGIVDLKQVSGGCRSIYLAAALKTAKPLIASPPIP